MLRPNADYCDGSYNSIVIPGTENIWYNGYIHLTYHYLREVGNKDV